MAYNLKTIIGGVASVMTAFVGANVLDSYVSGISFSVLGSSFTDGMLTLAVLILVLAGVAYVTDAV